MSKSTTTTDPIADLLTRIRNGLNAQRRFVDIRWSRMKQRIVEILKEEGLIDNYLVKVEETIGVIRIFLKYTTNPKSTKRKSTIHGLQRISSPGRRQYVACEEIPRRFAGLEISILSTSQGVMKGQEARKRRLGGEILCRVW